MRNRKKKIIFSIIISILIILGIIIFNNLSIETLSKYGSRGSEVTQIQTKLIPGHYEDTTEYPYLIIDTYKSIPMSPWFVHATYGSLEAALTKAKSLVEMLGIENIKLIKIVPFDQFIKIS